MMGHPSHLNPYGYRRPPSKFRRAASGTLRLAAYAAATFAVVAPWWIGVGVLWGAF